MALFEAGGIVGILLFFFWAWAIIDVISTDESQCRNLSKMIWLVIVLILPDLGALCWLLLGRPEHRGFAPGGSAPSSNRRPGYKGSGPYGPDSAPRYVTERDVTDRRSAELDSQLDAWEAKRTDLEARERALRERELEIAERELRLREDRLDN